MIGVEDWTSFDVDDFADFEELGGLAYFWTACCSTLVLGFNLLLVADDHLAIDEAADFSKKVVETQRLRRHLLEVRGWFLVKVIVVWQ